MSRSAIRKSFCLLLWIAPIISVVDSSLFGMIRAGIFLAFLAIEALCLARAENLPKKLLDGKYSTRKEEFLVYADFVRQCDVKDKQTLDSCLFQLIEKLKPHLPAGIEEWNIPIMEPMKINAISFSQGGGVVRIRASFKNLEVHGLTNYTTTYARSDPEKYRFTLGLTFPELRVTGYYEISGQLLLLPISGSGSFWALLNGVTADSFNWLDVTSGENGPQLRLTNTRTDFDIGRVRVRLNNLFNGDKFLGDTVNSFLNENSQEIIREIKPRFAREIDAIILKVFGDALAALPVEKWLGVTKKPSS